MKWLISFCDGKYSQTLKRLYNEAINLEVFDKVVCYTENDLDQDFLNKHGEFIKNNKRLYGYAIWKSYLIKKTLSLLNNNDILMYVDGGCTLNKNGLNRLAEYFNIVTKSPNGILTFRLPHLPDIQWTKMDTINQISTNLNDIMTGQIITTAFIIRKCDNSAKIINEFHDTCQNYHLIDDSPSQSKNFPQFIEHRHEQSVFSLVCKKHGVEILDDETYFKNEWNTKGKNFPIWATRYKY